MTRIGRVGWKDLLWSTVGGLMPALFIFENLAAAHLDMLHCRCVYSVLPLQKIKYTDILFIK